jgi:uncharacterized protein YdhG (YjbR/CyaY superfamily)
LLPLGYWLVLATWILVTSPPRPFLKFKKELSPYKSAKGSVQFPLDKPIPLRPREKIVTFRLSENLKKKGRK